ncbi:phosphodiesterase [Marinobacterium aestuariivivens]|uniref:Phosphodiesterase n=1 Tax=Marinobacterium aestuariivivens TaxID=1698799 RepID=A0ABW1ZY27_9GAMM
MDRLLLQISDCHLPAEAGGLFRGVDPERQLQAVAADIRMRFPDADRLLLTGDLTHHGGADSYRRLLDAVESLAPARHWLPGNHDVAAVMAQFGEPGLADKLIDTRYWRLLLLDSTARPDGRGGGSLAADELERLEAALATSGGRFVLIALHHNPVKVDSRWQDEIMLGNAGRFWQLVDACPQVRGVIFGHVHQTHDLQRGTVALFSAPSTAVQFEARRDDFGLEPDPVLAQPGYRVYRLQDDGCLKSRVVRVDCSTV